MPRHRCALGRRSAAQLARDHAHRVASLAVFGSAGLGDEVNADYTRGFVDAASRRELKPVVELLFADPSLVSRALVDDLLKYKRLDGVTELLGALHAALFEGGRQSATPLRDLADKPLLVVWGAQDRVIPAGHARHAPPHATVHVFDDAGHMVMMEKAGEVNTLLKSHIGA